VSHPLVRPAARAAAVLASALALTLGIATQAQAAALHPWTPASCATGQLTALGATYGGGFTALHGQVTGCEPYRANSAFAIVVFRPQHFGFATVYPESLVSYRPSGPTQFAGTIPTSEQLGVCAMRTLTVRIACARVTWPEDGPATLEPIATTDPLVAGYVDYEDDPREPPVGFCGSCLDDPQT
jgi:hypothetical protein